METVLSAFVFGLALVAFTVPLTVGLVLLALGASWTIKRLDPNGVDGQRD